MNKTLKELKEEMVEIQGEWNGDEPGTQEDRANIASDVLESIKNIEELLEELN